MTVNFLLKVAKYYIWNAYTVFVCIWNIFLWLWLLFWLCFQAICENYGFKIEKFSSLVDGKAIWCLLDYYFRKDLHCSCSLEVLYIFFSIVSDHIQLQICSICFILIIWSQDPQKAGGRESIMSAIDYPDAVHNFIFSQKLTTLLGNFPEVSFSQLFQYKRPINFYMFPRQYEVCSILPQVLCNGTPNKNKNENNSTSTCTNNTWIYVFWQDAHVYEWWQGEIFTKNREITHNGGIKALSRNPNPNTS